MKNKLNSFKKNIWIILIFTAVAGIGWILFSRFEGKSPAVRIEGLNDAIRARQETTLSVSDPENGLRSVRLILERGTKQTALLEKTYPPAGFLTGGDVFTDTLKLTIDPKKMGIADGPAVLRLTVRDGSWRDWWNGNAAVVEKTVNIDTRPPRIAVMNRQHNVVQGGSGLAVYRLSEPCKTSGIRVGETFFPGYPAAGLDGIRDESAYLCFFALNHTQGKNTPISAEAEDLAGNITKTGFPHHIRSRKFTNDTLSISDGFIQQILPTFLDQLSPEAETLKDQFLEINRKMRAENTGKLLDICAEPSQSLYWTGKFLRLPNSARRASFADHREYHYKGEAIDDQYHMGIDLASLAFAQVPAANSGIVVFTGNIGIYGQTVVIDHGFGLFSSYSHLSSMDATKGQEVSKGDIIGKTGSTGLAGGDHLHFSMMMHQTFVNPVEWWDPKWIENNIAQKIKSIKTKP